MEDEFWNTLRQRVSGYKPAPPKDTSAVEITSDAGEDKPQDMRISDPAPDTYTPAERTHTRGGYTSPRLSELLRYHNDSSLIQSVRISAYASSFNHYARFESDARRGFARVGTPAPKVSYFAYTPQYSTLNSDQLAYYMYFREAARHGEYIEADLSYILLYIYEVLNLPDLLPPKAGAESLAGLWLHYRRLYPETDKYLVEWLADYCLIHRLPLPKALYPILPELAARASLKAFYIPLDDETDEARRVSAQALIRCATDHAIKNNNPLFQHRAEAESYIEASIAHLLKCGCISARSLPSSGLSRLSRDAFCGALVSQTARRRIDIEVYPILRSQQLGTMISSAVRYSENKVRELYRIPSRLKAQPSDEIKRAMDEFFAPYMPQRQKPKDTAPEYEKLYDADTVYSGREELLAHARKLEAASWENVDILSIDTQDEEQPDEREHEITEEAPPRPDAAAQDDPFFEYRDAINAAMSGELRAYCRDHGLFEDDTAANINEIAQDVIGDTVLEYGEDGYAVIDDYRDLLTFSQ